MEDRETPPMRGYGESKMTRIMMATVPHVTSGSGLRKFQTDGFLFDRVYTFFPFLLSTLGEFSLKDLCILPLRKFEEIGAVKAIFRGVNEFLYLISMFIVQ
jgi:hypothetical protein